MNYYKIMSNELELLAITTYPTEADEWISPALVSVIDETIGSRFWSYDLIAQSEFETYQVFGIDEIKP